MDGIAKPNVSLLAVYDALFARWGPQGWWPAETPFEMMLGAVLTQNVAWTNVEKALANLREAGELNLPALANLSDDRLSERIRPAGFYRQKTRYVRFMVDRLLDRFSGDLDRLFALETPALRAELLSWTGIGPETADSILLYAAHRPVFVVDAYTRRVFSRLGHCAPDASYDELACLFRTALPADVALFNEYHALIVRLAKTHCKTRPDCRNCPLAIPGKNRAFRPKVAKSSSSRNCSGIRLVP